jgi:hypothetical protein
MPSTPLTGGSYDKLMEYLGMRRDFNPGVGGEASSTEVDTQKPLVEGQMRQMGDRAATAKRVGAMPMSEDAEPWIRQMGQKQGMAPEDIESMVDDYRQYRKQQAVDRYAP